MENLLISSRFTGYLKPLLNSHGGLLLNNNSTVPSTSRGQGILISFDFVVLCMYGTAFCDDFFQACTPYAPA